MVTKKKNQRTNLPKKSKVLLRDGRIIPQKARVMICNDDGIYAPGLEALERVASELFDDVWIVAPDRQRSGAGHSLTMHRPLRITHVGPQRYSVDGTPTDAVMLGIKEIMESNPPDIVLSGINSGVNLGEDVMYSGTVAAALEAIMLGIPAIALSLAVDSEKPVKWSTAEFHAVSIINTLCEKGWTPGTLINVNIPNLAPNKVKGIKITQQGQRQPGDQIFKNTDPRGKEYYWIGPWETSKSTRPDTDLEALDKGFISVTPLNMDMTYTPLLKHLEDIFKK